MTLSEEREQWEREALAMPLPDGVGFKREEISGVDCVWITHANTSSDSMIVYLHGGGLVAGSAITHRQIAANLVGACNQPVLLVNYRLLPEYLYPAPLDDLLQVYSELLTNSGFTSDQIVFGGDSSGATLVLAALVKLREAGVKMPRCAFTVSAAFDMTLTSKSMINNDSVDPYLSKAALKKWQSDYLNYDLKSPDISALYSRLSDLPPLLLLIGGQDPWRCDSIIVADKIRQCGGSVKLLEWKEMGHVWIDDYLLDDSQDAFQKISEFCKSTVI